MKIAGGLLLISGWILVLFALGMLAAGAARNTFILAGIAIQALGMVLAARAHIAGRAVR